MKKLAPHHFGLLAVIIVGVVARLSYRSLGVRFSAAPLTFYIQFLDAELLRHDLLRSLFYLRDQPPLFNAFAGLIVKLFPQHHGEAFGVLYFAGGIAFGVILYLLMLRLRVAPAWAAVVTVLFVDGPIVILYENWLFYTFPLAIILCGSALALARYLQTRRRADAALFFWLLATLVLARNLFHPLWMLSLVAALVVVERGRRRQVALAALAPTLVVLALLVKHLIVFGSLFQGQPIQQMNLAVMTSMRLPEDERARLVREGKLTPFSQTPIIAAPVAFRRLLPPPAPPPTGIPVLDEDYKTGTSYSNWNNSVYVAAGERYGADAQFALRHYPRVYLEAVRENVERYLLPGDQTDPFNTRSYQNRLAIQPLLTGYNRLFAWQRAPRRTPWLHCIGFPLLLLFALAVVVRAIRGRQIFDDASPDRAVALTMAYALYATLWLSAATLLLSYGDHNRYRFKASAFYCLFLALLGQWALAAGRRVIRRYR
jgi:hypothetical protein